MLHSKPKIQHKCAFSLLLSKPNIPLRIVQISSLPSILPYLHPVFTRKVRGHCDTDMLFYKIATLYSFCFGTMILIRYIKIRL